jgi:hypothetical protein
MDLGSVKQYVFVVKMELFDDARQPNAISTLKGRKPYYRTILAPSEDGPNANMKQQDEETTTPRPSMMHAGPKCSCWTKEDASLGKKHPYRHCKNSTCC